VKLVACHECDLLSQLRPLQAGDVARCARCGALLGQQKANSLERTLALMLAAAVLFVLAHVFPFLALKEAGLIQETTLISGVVELYRQDLWGVATLVLLTTVMVPATVIFGLLYVLLPLHWGWTPWQLPRVFRLVRLLQPWGMLEVFMVGILVSMVKLVRTAEILPGVALYSFAALVLVLAGSVVTLDPQAVWERVRVKA
jgi:paraquat-inducible protein A